MRKFILFSIFLFSTYTFANDPMSFVCGNDYVQIYTNENMVLDSGSVNNETSYNVAMNREVKNGLAHTMIRLILKNKNFVILDYREDGYTTLQKGHMIGDIGMPLDDKVIECRRPING
ncbi:hypothetical protein [Atlantibacter hermannii]|uniref:hypothetical protein n=1 Tax=Atlantibacter hermannii TaxID=565 RepID=UPI002FD995D6